FPGLSALAQADRHVGGAVTQEVSFHFQTRGVPGEPELLLPGSGVGAERCADPIKVRAGDAGLFCRTKQFRGGGAQCAVSLPAGGGVGEGSQAEQVTGSARFCAGPDRRLLPAPERLPAHDRTGDPSVHVEVARLHRVEPLAYLCGVEGMDTTGEAVVDLVDVL